MTSPRSVGSQTLTGQATVWNFMEASHFSPVFGDTPTGICDIRMRMDLFHIDHVVCPSSHGEHRVYILFVTVTLVGTVDMGHLIALVWNYYVVDSGNYCHTPGCWMHERPLCRNHGRQGNRDMVISFSENIKMRNRLVTVACVAAAIGLVGAFAFAHQAYTAPDGQLLAPFEFRPEGATSPEAAAQVLFLGVATASPRDFGKHVLLGVCNNEVDVLNRYAESLHLTPFSHNGEAFTYYELRDQRDDSGRLRLINRKKPIRVIASASFDSQDPRVKALNLEAAGTYAGKRFVSVDVAGMGYYDGIEYQSRVVVAKVGSGWFAMPRCASSKNFYAIADGMQLRQPQK